MASPKKKLPNKPNATNWVEKAGGLPDYIRRIAEHLHGQGHATGSAIAMAVNTVKKWCTTGTNHNGGKLTEETKAQACAAYSSWKAKAAGTKLTEVFAMPSELALVGDAARARLALVEGMLLTLGSEEPSAAAVAGALALAEGKQAKFEIGGPPGDPAEVGRAREALQTEADILRALAESLTLEEAPKTLIKREIDRTKPKGKKGIRPSGHAPAATDVNPERVKGTELRLGAGVTAEPDERVTHLQNRLSNLGHQTRPDGKFGPKTNEAIRTFQKENGLKDDGVVGPATTEALQKAQPKPSEEEAGEGEAAGAEVDADGKKKPKSSKPRGIRHKVTVEPDGRTHVIVRGVPHGMDVEEAVSQVIEESGLPGGEGVRTKIRALVEIAERNGTATVGRFRLDEFRSRGSAARAAIKRLDDGTFAPKGRGRVLSPAEKLRASQQKRRDQNASANRRTEVGIEMRHQRATRGRADAFDAQTARARASVKDYGATPSTKGQRVSDLGPSKAGTSADEPAVARAKASVAGYGKGGGKASPPAGRQGRSGGVGRKDEIKGGTFMVGDPVKVGGQAGEVVGRQPESITGNNADRKFRVRLFPDGKEVEVKPADMEKPPPLKLTPEERGGKASPALPERPYEEYKGGRLVKDSKVSGFHLTGGELDDGALEDYVDGLSDVQSMQLFHELAGHDHMDVLAHIADRKGKHWRNAEATLRLVSTHPEDFRGGKAGNPPSEEHGAGIDAELAADKKRRSRYGQVGTPKKGGRGGKASPGIPPASEWKGRKVSENAAFGGKTATVAGVRGSGDSAKFVLALPDGSRTRPIGYGKLGDILAGKARIPAEGGGGKSSPAFGEDLRATRQKNFKDDPHTNLPPGVPKGSAPADAIGKRPATGKKTSGGHQVHTLQSARSEVVSETPSGSYEMDYKDLQPHPTRQSGGSAATPVVINRRVHLSPRDFNTFSQSGLEMWDFLEGAGGGTRDGKTRVVEVTDGRRKIWANPEGGHYARYSFTHEPPKPKVESYDPKKGPSAAQKAKNAAVMRGGKASSPATATRSREYNEISGQDSENLVTAAQVGSLQGKSIVVTGKLPNLTRRQAEGRVEDRGGRITSIDRKRPPDLLIVGEKAGSKLRKAREKGIPVMTWDEARKLFEATWLSEATFAFVEDW